MIRKRRPDKKSAMLDKPGFRKKVCRFCVRKIERIDFLDERELRRSMTERGKIVPRRISGTCAKHQRMVAQAVKRARFLALVPYVAENIR